MSNDNFLLIDISENYQKYRIEAWLQAVKILVFNVFYVSLVERNLETYPCFADVLNLTADLSILSAVM